MTESTVEPRVRPPADLEGSVVEPLLASGYFRRKFEVMAFAAALAYALGLPPREVGVTGEGIRLSIFRANRQEVGIDLIGIDVSRDLTAISDDRLEERVRVFEQYAAAGLLYLQEQCFEASNDVLAGLIRVVERTVIRQPEDDLPFDVI